MATDLAIQVNIPPFDSVQEARRIDRYRGIDIENDKAKEKAKAECEQGIGIGRIQYTSLVTYKEIERDLPFLPQDIMEVIAMFCYNIDTLLKLAIFFPYLVKQIKDRNLAESMPVRIPDCIDDIINWENLINSDNNMQIFKMRRSNIFEYFKNIMSIYLPNTWLYFIINSGSNFHKTYNGIEITKYVISCLSNKELRTLSYKVLAYIVKYNIYLYNDKLTNLIYQRLSQYFSESKKDKEKDKNKISLITLITAKQKDNVKYDNPKAILILLSNMSHNYINLSAVIISALTIYNRHILNILLENNKLNELNGFDVMEISQFIVFNPLDDYLLVKMFKYYFELISFDNDPYNCMSHIFELAINNKNHHIIIMIYDIEKHKQAISKLIIDINTNDFYNKNNCENLKYLLLYCKNLDLSLLSWSTPNTFTHFHLEYHHDLQTLNAYILLFENAKLYDANLDNMDRHLLLKIYNYFNKYYIVNKLHITTSKVYPELYAAGIDISIIKEHLHYLFNDLTDYFTLINKCKYIMKLSDIKFIKSSSNIKNRTKSLRNKSIYLYNIYTFILKHKLYYSIQLNNFITSVSIHLLHLLKRNDNNMDSKLIEIIEKCISIDQSVGEVS